MNILKSLKGIKKFSPVVLFTSLFFLLRFPSLFEPLWYGDEGIYQVIGNSLNHGKLLYRDIFDNKPPLLYWLYSLFNSDQFLIRLASLIFGIICIGLFFLLVKKLFKDTKNNNTLYLTIFTFTILFGLPTIEGNIANAENFMLLPIIAAALLIINQRKLFIAGLFLGIAFLFKIVAVFDLLAFLIFLFIVNLNSIKKQFKLIPVIVGFLLPIFSVILFFVFNHAFVDFIKATFISNISYVNYGNRIGSFPGFLIIKPILLGIFLLYLFVKRKKINQGLLFILIWFSFSVFNSLFSQRPYTHYLLLLIPSLSLMTGSIFIYKKHWKLVVVTLLSGLIIVTRIFGIPNFGKSISYYQNFILYLLGEKQTASYQGFFDRKTPFDYEVSRFVKPKLDKSDSVFVWGNNAQLYQLLDVVAPGKYIVAYHILNYEDGLTTTKKALESTKPKFIIVMLNVGPIPFSLINYSDPMIIGNTLIYERIF